ncbi:MAG: UMP kinase [Methanomassiliicoccales archaeon]|nr:UMP kinase [Methanomassiliicoccales archaeon]NYT14717.1 UMP kinase [Methanomassiliicoccales archaeon]
MAKVVVSLGGSILIPDENDIEFLKEIASLLSSLSEDQDIIAVCGGGRIARYYIRNGRQLGASEEKLDELGIEITRLNARLLQMALGDKAEQGIPRTPEEAVDMKRGGRIVTMGGTEPGHTTDAVAALVAKAWKADRIVNATSVDAVYSDDPKKVTNAKRYSWLSFEDFYRIVNKGIHDAGQTAVFDRKGALIALQERIPVYIIHGRDLNEISSAISGGDIKGTTVL